MTKFKLRRANQDDAEAIAQVQLQSWREAYGDFGIDDFLKSQTLTDRAKAWKGHLDPAKAPNATFVAYLPNGAHEVHEPHKGKSIVAFCSSGPSRVPAYQGWGEVYALYCVERAQGLGIGRALMVRQAAYLGGLGYTCMFVRTMKRGRAKHFYQHLGGQFLFAAEVEFGGVQFADITYGWPQIAQLA